MSHVVCPMSYAELKDMLDASSFFFATNKKNCMHKYKAFDLTRKNNLWLKELLLVAGYNTFVPDRSINIVYYHQVIAFFFVSPNKDVNGAYTGLHIHHLSGNCGDNSPSNLIYLSEADHLIVTKFQRKASTFKVKYFYTNNCNSTPFNSKGNKVKNWAKFILGVIAVTVAKTYEYSGFKFVSPPSIINRVVAFAIRVVNRLFNNKNNNKSTNNLNLISAV